MDSTRQVPRIAAVEPASGSSLTVTWEDGSMDQVDLSGWIALGGTPFAVLRDEAIFSTATVVDYGLTVQWGDDEDLAIDSFHLKGICEQQRPFSQDEIAGWQDRMSLSNQEAADLLGVQLSTWHNYKSGATRVPHGVQIACRAVERDRVLLAAHYRPRYAGRPTAGK